MERYLAEIEGQIQHKQRKHASYNKIVAVLTSFGMWLIQAGYTTETPARRLHTLPEQPTPMKALDRSIVVKVLDAAHHTGDLRDALVLELLAHSGMRAHEVAAIHVEDLEVGRRTTWVRIVGKGQKQRRIPLPKPVGLLIQDYLHQRVAKEGQQPIHGPLLVGERGGLPERRLTALSQK
jgi:integrase/recombinase XerC